MICHHRIGSAMTYLNDIKDDIIAKAQILLHARCCFSTSS